MRLLLFFVNFAWTEEKILRYQRVLIIFSIIWGLITAILTLVQGMINVTGAGWNQLLQDALDWSVHPECIIIISIDLY